MQKSFKYEGIEIQYSLIKENRKTIAVSVYPNLQIELKTPLEIDDKKIDKFLKRKIIWIENQIDYFKKYKTLKARKYISGESLLYLGRQYKLVVEKAYLKQEVKLSKGLIKVYSHNPASSKLTKELIDAWYSDKSHKIFKECLNRALDKFDYEKDFQVISRKLNKRWGSYVKRGKRITLNEELIKAPKTAIIYVITHELCHFTHYNHSKDFYNLLESKISNWKNVKEKLELRFSDK